MIEEGTEERRVQVFDAQSRRLPPQATRREDE
jgi:hypothetical protein